MEKNSTNFSEFKIEREDISLLINQADKIVFKADVKSICNQLDLLFSIAGKSQIKNNESSIFEPKIRSGIMRLKKMEAFEEAAFYETEILKFQISNHNHNNNKFVIYLFVFCITGLFLIAFFANDINYQTFSLYKKVIDTIINYFK
jgi:hypothetical protein